MVCSRCKMVVASVFENMGMDTISVELGEVELKNAISSEQKQNVLKSIRALGFELSR